MSTSLIQIRLISSLKEKLDNIKEKRGMSSISEVLRYCISETHAKEFKDYVEIQRARLSVDPKEKAIMKADAAIEAETRREEARARKERERQTNICAVMGGTVITDAGGIPACKYTMYSMASPWIVNEREVIDQLENLNDETPLLQYQGLMNERGEEGRKVIEAARIKIAKAKEKQQSKISK